MVVVLSYAAVIFGDKFEQVILNSLRLIAPVGEVFEKSERNGPGFAHLQSSGVRKTACNTRTVPCAIAILDGAARPSVQYVCSGGTPPPLGGTPGHQLRSVHLPFSVCV